DAQTGRNTVLRARECVVGGGQRAQRGHCCDVRIDTSHFGSLSRGFSVAYGTCRITIPARRLGIMPLSGNRPTRRVTLLNHLPLKNWLTKRNHSLKKATHRSESDRRRANSSHRSEQKTGS